MTEQRVPLPTDRCDDCDKPYNLHTPLARYCPNKRGEVFDSNKRFRPKPLQAEGPTPVKDMNEVFPGKQPESIATNSAEPREAGESDPVERYKIQLKEKLNAEITEADAEAELGRGKPSEQFWRGRLNALKTTLQIIDSTLPS